MKKTLLALMILPLFFACSKEDQREVDEDLIREYIADNSLDGREGEDGLFYVIEKEGNGARPELSSEVTVHYEGYLLDGDVFDSSYERGMPATFPLTGVIRGWQLGIPLFKEGGKGKLLIPSHLGYGSNPPPGSGIPRDAVLVFDIELLDVN
jgi:FKBP-type peptidyl-prolyl cis-trans isomerase